ncbi:hypothetical protein EIN_484440 [Entamoeba invadens IP1]|uniref:Uncharacterized protein n=1 Tax=Entamoeba invadens IP1 TaxID=370355 RepID=A0A0A1U4C9_ENTIV|nr:hypothetical protein EIN_484440 [Entamoeba invadens IP1]ELP89122.1 hypothetical protein EIN_484440 [Entamoeba invadens IP1]|eukprot:XP_004255893.1 hypothetical protein EIN_484440 [Entamoeba invadens IP1]
MTNTSDIISFICMNKKYKDVVDSMYINPYKLSYYNSVEKIQKLFPALQTLYLTDLITKNRKLQTDVTHLEIDFLSCSKTFLFIQFNKKNIIEKIRKLRIKFYNLDCLTSDVEMFQNLQDLFVDLSMFTANSNDRLFEMIGHRTLRRVILTIYASQLEVFSKFDYSKHPLTDYVFIVIEMDLDDIKENSKVTQKKLQYRNVKIYSAIYTNFFDFIPIGVLQNSFYNVFVTHFSDFDENDKHFSRDVLNRDQILVDSYCDKCDVAVTEVINKCLLNNVVLKNYNNDDIQTTQRGYLRKMSHHRQILNFETTTIRTISMFNCQTSNMKTCMVMCIWTTVF